MVLLYDICDFSVLLRTENSRLAKAGFPTKISESLVHGVPVICNLSSDLNKYLVDGVNSIIVKGENPEDFTSSLLVASQKTREDLNQMRKKSRKSFEDNLDSSLFKEILVNHFNN